MVLKYKININVNFRQVEEVAAPSALCSWPFWGRIKMCQYEYTYNK